MAAQKKLWLTGERTQPSALSAGGDPSWHSSPGRPIGGGGGVLERTERAGAGVGRQRRTGALVVAGVYLALVVALLLAFGGPVRLHDLLRFRYYTSASDLRLALGIRVLCWAAIALAYGVLSPELGPPQDALLQLCPASAPTCPAFRPPSRSRSARSLLGRVF